MSARVQNHVTGRCGRHKPNPWHGWYARWKPRLKC